MRVCGIVSQDPSVTRVTEPPPSSGQEEYNPFAEDGKPAKKEEPQVRRERDREDVEGRRGKRKGIGEVLKRREEITDRVASQK